MKFLAFGVLVAIAAKAISQQYEVVILPNVGSHMRAEAVQGGTIAGHEDGAPPTPIAWIGPTFTPIRLSYQSGVALATSGSSVGGYLQLGSTYSSHRAVMWRLGASRPVVTDLHTGVGPFISTWVYGMNSQMQVGAGSYFEPGWFIPTENALLWRGTASSAVNLHPKESTTYRSSVATDVDGDIQVGSVGTYSPYIGGEKQAVMWRGSAESISVLHPTGASYSEALAVSGTTIVGYYDSGGEQPVIWRVGQVGYTTVPHNGHRGLLADTNGGVHVGYVAILGGGHNGGVDYRATAWVGNELVQVDLHSMLPTGISDSFAEGVDAEGNIVGRGNVNDPRVAILWKRIRR